LLTTRLREPLEPDFRRVPRPTALVVDDDFWIRALVCDLLEAEGYEVQQASNGSAALRLARRQPPRVMLLDLALPELSGLSVLACMKADSSTSQVPVIVVSGEVAVARAAAHWAAAIVPKPFVLSDLLAKVAHALHAPLEVAEQLHRG
jgi:DNA-binding response OmpR family regulator